MSQTTNMNFETKLNEIQEALKVGQVTPGELAAMKDFLAGYSSSLMERQLQLQLQYASFFRLIREHKGSDKAVLMDWRNGDMGKEELTLEVTQKRIKTLMGAISSHLRVAHDEAYNRV